MSLLLPTNLWVFSQLLLRNALALALPTLESRGGGTGMQVSRGRAESSGSATGTQGSRVAALGPSYLGRPPSQPAPPRGWATHLPAQLSSLLTMESLPGRGGNVSRLSPAAPCRPVLPPTRADEGKGRAQGASWMHENHRTKARFWGPHTCTQGLF